MIRHLFVVFFVLTCLPGKTQCPLILNTLGVYTSTPQFINCNGNSYTVNFQSNSSFGTYTINWGDGGPVTTGASYTANTIITHSYAATTATYPLVLQTGTCTINGIVVQEQAAQAAIIPGSVGSLCAPKTLTFTNGTTFTSATTSYTWSFGDNTDSSTVHSFTNAGQAVIFTYNKGSVSCATQVTLSAQNYCNFTPSRATFGPLQVYDVDQAAIGVDRQVRCWPDNIFPLSNSSNQNCLLQGNTGQRYERWNFGDLGLGHDSIIDWNPWPPSPVRNIAFPGIGSYTVLLVDSNACGISSSIINLNIVPPPTAAVIGPTANICVNTPVTFTNANSGATQHRWNFGTGGGFVNLGSGSKTFTYTTPGTYTVRLVGFINGGGNACMDTAQTIVNVVARPVASLAASPVNGCNTITTVFTDASTGAVSWNWTFGNGNTSVLQVPPAQSYTAPGVYTATLLVTNTNNCTDSRTATVVVRPKPLPAFTQFSACEDAPVTFTNNSTVPAPNSITGYTWNFGDGSPVSTATVPVHAFTTPGTYTVKLAASTAFCSDSVMLPVTVNIVPTASFIASPSIGCPPFTVNFSNLSQDAVDFFWRFSSSPNHTASTTGAGFTYTNITQSAVNHTVTLISSTTEGCTDSINTTVTVRPKPEASFTVNTITGCSPKITSFSNTSIGANTQQWDFGDGAFSQQLNPTHTYSNGTLFTQTLTAVLVVSNSVTCSDTSSVLITVYPEALTTFTMVPAFGCSPLTVNFPSVPGVATYSWSHGDSTPTFTTLTSHSWTFTNSSLIDKTFSITLDAQTSNGCLGSGAGTLVVFHNPVADFTTNVNAGCTPLTVSFSNTSSGHNNSVWRYGNGLSTISNNGLGTYTNQTGGAQVTYTASLLVTTNEGCRDSATGVLTVFAQPQASFTPDTPACTPKTIRFTNLSAGATSYSWNFGNGAGSSLQQPERLYVNTGLIDETYLVRLRVTSADLCSDSIQIPLVIHPKPQFFISSFPDSGCAPLKVTFSRIGGVQDYEWKYDGISFGSTGDISNIFGNTLPVTKTYSIELIARDRHSCVDTATKTVRVFPLPVARFSARPMSVFVPNQEVFFVNESSSNATSYTWTLGDGAGSNERSPSHFYTRAGEYQAVLMVSTDKSCRDTFALPEKIVALEETTIQMPNAFTPNTAGSPGLVFDPNDASNDIFHPNVKGTDQYEFSIYSRWGELLFVTRNPLEGWDGYYKGKLCTPDVYVWKIKASFIDGKSFNKTGDVLLLR